MIQSNLTTTILTVNCREQVVLVKDSEAMNRVALTTFSFFDSGSQPSEECEPERFYHGFVLTLWLSWKIAM